jgi:hypothetical protein
VDYLNYIIKFERHPTDGIALGAFSAKVKIRVYENRNLGLRRCSIKGLFVFLSYFAVSVFKLCAYSLNIVIYFM